MIKKFFSKKTILLTTLVLTIILSTCINVSAETLANISYDIIPLKVQIYEYIGPAGPIGSPNLDYKFRASYTDFNGYLPNGDYYTKYSWDFGDGSYSSEVTPSHQYRRSGRYNVKVRIECLPVPGNPGEPLNMIMYRGDVTKTIITSR